MMSLFELRHSVSIHRGVNIPRMQLAAFCGINHTKMKRIELGQKAATTIEAEKIAEFYGISMDDMLKILKETLRRYEETHKKLENVATAAS